MDTPILGGLGFTVEDEATGIRLQPDTEIFGAHDLNSAGAPFGFKDKGFQFTNIGIGKLRLEFTHPGFDKLVIEGDYPLTGYGFDGNNYHFKMKRNGQPSSKLHCEARGNDLVDEHGNPVCYSAINQALAYRMWLDKRFAELDALIKESHEFNFNWWSVYFQGSKNQNTIFDLSPQAEPEYYQQLRPFGTELNNQGIGIHAVIGVDNQDIKSDYPHWTKVDNELNGLYYIFDGGNEADKNGFDPQLVPTPNPNTIWSRGSATADKLVPQNGATAASFHQRTDYPATIMDAVASSVYMADHGYTIVMCTEPTRFNLDGTNKSGQPDSPRFAYQLASIYNAMWDFTCFFNQSGQRGMLLTPQLRDIAAGWAKGMAL